jgi:hypothetical protein
MVEPTAALDGLVQESIRPQAQALAGMVRELLGTGAEDRMVQRVMFSVVGQCMFYRNCQAVIVRLTPGWTCGTEEIESIANHITEFSLAAIHVLRGN